MQVWLSGCNLSEWIENLVQDAEAKGMLEAMQKERVEQGHSLIARNAPELWDALTSRIEQDVKDLAKSFPDMAIRFERDLADKIVVTNSSTEKAFTAQCIPEQAAIKLTFREKLLGLEGVETGQDQINLVTSPSGETVMMWDGFSGPEKISEHLLKRLIPEP